MSYRLIPFSGRCELSRAAPRAGKHRIDVGAAAGPGRHAPCRWHRFLPVAAIILLGAVIAGCAVPSYVASLDTVLDHGAIQHHSRYGYRCTAGAHRGKSNEYGENTLAALKAADEDSRYAFIEFDVQYTRERRIVVYHDKRMLRLYGRLTAIGDATFAQLSEMTDGEIAAYDDVIGALEKKLNIEIKSRGDDREDECLVDEIMADLQARKRDKDVMISSISGHVITYIKQKYPDMPTGQVFWLTSSTYLHFEGLTRKLYEEIDDTRADYLMLHVANLRNIEDLLKFKPKGKTIVFWDFDDTIFIVHKDFSDRLWGTSGLSEFFQWLRYKLVQP